MIPRLHRHTQHVYAVSPELLAITFCHHLYLFQVACGLLLHEQVVGTDLKTEKVEYLGGNFILEFNLYCINHA